MRMVRITLRTDMIVCLCHRVSDRDIAQAVSTGCASFDELQDELRIGLGCGACQECARSAFETHRAQPGVASRGRTVPSTLHRVPA